jgi:dethiobiotin synthetase
MLISGTATEIGKTWVGVRLIEELKERSIPIVARKPVQSFENDAEPTDADLLAAASGESPYDVCPAHRWYGLPLAPPMAAEVLGEPPLALEALVAETKVQPGKLTLLEGVGGPRSPLTDDADTVELADALDVQLVILVGDAELGAINSIQLCLEAFGERDMVVMLNRYDDAQRLHQMNRSWLEDVSGVKVFTTVEALADEIAERADVDVNGRDRDDPEG